MTSRHVPFRDVELTPEDEQRCHDRAFQLIDRTLRSYDERDGQGETIPRHHSILDNARWKLLKTNADASLYVERDSRSRRDLKLLGSDWEHPVVVMMAGTIRADLDEVMLGMSTPDFASLKVRTEALAKQPVDGAVLVDLMQPTEDDPFQAMAIQWTVLEPKWPVKAVVHPRDFVTLSSTGIMTRDNGDRIGYEVVLPADLRQCPPLAKPFVRGKFMHAAIFKQQEPGVVDVYVHAFVETQNFILDKISVSMTWKSTIGVATQLAEMKKLQWCIAHCTSRRQQQQMAPSNSKACRKCFEKRVTSHRRSESSVEKHTCALCGSPTCSSCLEERTLKISDERSIKLKERRVFVCRDCMTFVRQQRPADIAREMLTQTQEQKEAEQSSSGSTASSQGNHEPFTR
ncbi:hypothetical protein PHYBOEH_009718 [Phytophthora boehmeriae]|uniref:FYVE-type domain-containing protein n=1 Tax=Phytophthora boehmeriae TaxID=109152 RepID=A0A8T1VWM6_9STRA|nr:hypothetical protein PHYBOEH_009718 [Phytophthora boehmeriae]